MLWIFWSLFVTNVMPLTLDLRVDFTPRRWLLHNVLVHQPMAYPNFASNVVKLKVKLTWNSAVGRYMTSFTRYIPTHSYYYTDTFLQFVKPKGARWQFTAVWSVKKQTGRGIRKGSVCLVMLGGLVEWCLCNHQIDDGWYCIRQVRYIVTYFEIMFDSSSLILPLSFFLST